MNKRRAYRAGDIAVISAAAPGSVRVVIEAIVRGQVFIGWQLPLGWTVGQCEERKRV